MMRFLSGGIAVLLGLLLIGRLRRVEPVPVRDSTVGPVAAPTPRRLAQPVVGPPQEAALLSGTPIIDLLARLESRRRLAHAASYTYFDSLFVETDSVVRRWPEPSTPLLLAVLPDSGGLDPSLVARVRAALTIWEDAGTGLRFTLTSDTSGAQLLVQSTGRLEGNRIGETQLDWLRDGAIRGAVITLAKSDSSGHLLPPAVALAAAVHEVGHSLGLPHSPNPNDVMFPVTKHSRLSDRDRATMTLLYILPLGTIREHGRSFEPR